MSEKVTEVSVVVRFVGDAPANAEEVAECFIGFDYDAEVVTFEATPDEEEI